MGTGFLHAGSGALAVLGPLVTFLCLSLIIQWHFERGWRESFLLSAGICGTGIVLLTELLSLARAFSFVPVCLFWGTAGAAGIYLIIPILRPVLWRAPVLPADFTREEYVLAAVIAGVCVATAITAAAGVPNTWDALVYHLPRAAHWIQDRGVDLYPTNIIRQIAYCPFPEYVIAQLLVLHAPQSALNFVEWSAMAGSLMAVSLIARELGAARRGQLLAAALAVTLPMGIAQAVSTQTDYVAAFWVLSCVYFLLALRRPDPGGRLAAAGISLGLGMLSKGYALLYTAPFLAGAFVSMRRFPKILWSFAVIAALAAGINAGYAWRSLQVRDMVAAKMATLVNAGHGLQVTAGNVLRNIGVHIGTPSGRLNGAMTDAFARAAYGMRIDINDPRAVFAGTTFTIDKPSMNEDMAANPWHAVLFTVAFALILAVPRYGRGLRWFTAGTMAGFLLLCAVVRYQPCISRFHLGLFLLAAAPAAVCCTRAVPRWGVPLVVLLCAAGLPWLVSGRYHPWFGPRSIFTAAPSAQYFAVASDALPLYEEAARQVKAVDCRDIGVMTAEDSLEYPLWILLGPSGGRAIRMEHAGVENGTEGLPRPLGHFQPCAVIAVERGVPSELMIQGRPFRPSWHAAADDMTMAVYVPAVHR